MLNTVEAENSPGTVRPSTTMPLAEAGTEMTVPSTVIGAPPGTAVCPSTINAFAGLAVTVAPSTVRTWPGEAPSWTLEPPPKAMSDPDTEPEPDSN